MVRSFLLSPLPMATVYRAALHSHSASPSPICHPAAFLPNTTRTASPKLLRSWNGMYFSQMVRVQCASTAVSEINQKVAEFYDSSSSVWEEMWGHHMHHGFYDVNADQHRQLSFSDHKAAQIRMIEEALSFAGVTEEERKRPRSIVDVGCGLGGSSRYLARKYGASVNGITNSPIQASRCTALTSAAGMSDQVGFEVADALNMPFSDGHFDLVWSLESAEHMPDKQKFFSEMVRVAAPGGHIIIATVCHRDLLPGEASLKPDEKELLEKIVEAFHLPAWCSRADYVKLAQSMHLQDIKSADWSENVTPWSGAMKTAFSWKAIGGLLRSGWKAIKPMLGAPYRAKAHSQGLVQYSIISARKAT